MTALELHPEIAAAAGGVRHLDLDDASLLTFRAAIANGGFPALVPLSDAIERVDHVVSEEPYVVVRVHTPRDLRAPAPCLFTIHGGGYVLGSYDMEDVPLDQFGNEFGCVGVSVEYRLAPDTPYPGPLDDCLAGLEWTIAHADELGVDPARVGIMGASAGGGLCAALALLARDRGAPAIAFQLLQCPMIDDRQITASSRADELLVWTHGSNAFGWRSYLGELYGRADVPGYAAPTRAENLAGLPPTMMIIGGADGFRDENLDFGVRLVRAGVPTDLCVIAGAPHGVGLFVGTEPERRWSRAVREWLRPHLDVRA